MPNFELAKIPSVLCNHGHILLIRSNDSTTTNNPLHGLVYRAAHSRSWSLRFLRFSKPYLNINCLIKLLTPSNRAKIECENFLQEKRIGREKSLKCSICINYIFLWKIALGFLWAIWTAHPQKRMLDYPERPDTGSRTVLLPPLNWFSKNAETVCEKNLGAESGW